MRQRIHEKIFWYSCLGLVFSLPIHGRLVPPFILLMIVNWLIQGSYFSTFSRFIREPWRIFTLMLATLYFVYLIGLLYTTDFTYAWFDLQVKLSLLIFPLIFSTSTFTFDKRKTGQLLSLFVLACLISTLILFCRASYRWYITGDIDHFYYSALSWHLHASYLSMYLSVAIAIMAMQLIQSWVELSHVKRYVRIAIIAWLMLFVVLLSSKAGMIGLVLLNLIFPGWLIAGKKTRVTGVVVLVISTAYLFFLVKTFPYGLARSNYKDVADMVLHDKKPKIDARKADQMGMYSNADRMGIYMASISVLRSHWLIGVGTGDVKDVLQEQYKTQHFYRGYNFHLNAHSQILQTFMALGIAGFLALGLMILLPARLAIRRRDLLSLAFLALFVLNILVESMFEVQAGVVFLGFFNTFLFIREVEKKEAGSEAGSG